MFSRLAVFMALAAIASANYYSYEPTCIKDGEKCSGAKGYDMVYHKPCCSKGYKCVDVTGWVGKQYGEPKGWGSHCLKVEPKAYPKCTPIGARCTGQTGYDWVMGATCCDGGSCEGKEGYWGKFCVAKKTYDYKPKPTAAPKYVPSTPKYEAPKPKYVAPTPKPSYGKKCYAIGERCMGAPGKPAVEYLGCCEGSCTGTSKAYGAYGTYCEKDYGRKPESKKCYKEGERCIGAKGKPYVEYLGDSKWDGCCDGYACTGTGSKYGYDAYGKYCVAVKKTYY